MKLKEQITKSLEDLLTRRQAEIQTAKILKLIVQNFDELAKLRGYVQLDKDQSLPKANIDIHIWRDYTPDIAYEKAQQDMLKTRFKKVKDG